jgi:hypothetical protein
LKKFLHCRFDELTMKPLRGIVTHWVKLLEPRRLGDWGKYHEKLPSEAETPPWWPKTVIYKEPSHLKKNGEFRVPMNRTTLISYQNFQRWRWRSCLSIARSTK